AVALCYKMGECAGGAGMDNDPVGAPNGGALELGLLDRGQMHARPDPVGEEDRVFAVGGAEDDVRITDRGFRLIARHSFVSEPLAHFLAEGLAAFLAWPEAADRVHLAHGANRHQLRARLP